MGCRFLFSLYEVAEEIRDPFGNDLNDIDMDKATDEICRDLMFMQKHYKQGYKTLVERQGEEKGSVETRESSFQSSYDIIVSQDVGERESEKKKLTRMHAFKLAFHSISKLTFASLTVWSLGITFLSRSWVERGTEDASVVCSSPWWCTKLVVESRMFKFGGFALFLLLGQRLYDSHERYSDALILWGEEMKHTCMIASNRMFGGFVRGSWHKGDFERIAGHLCGFIMCSAAELRFWESKDEDLGLQKELEYVLEEKDVERVMMSEQKSDYCLDVVRAYVVASEFGKKEVYPSNEVRK